MTKLSSATYITLTGSNAAVSFTPVMSAFESGEPAVASQYTESAWFRYQPTEDGIISLSGPTVDGQIVNLITVYSGPWITVNGHYAVGPVNGYGDLVLRGQGGSFPLAFGPDGSGVNFPSGSQIYIQVANAPQNNPTGVKRLDIASGPASTVDPSIPPPATHTLHNNAAGGTDGTTVTVENSGGASGDPWSVVESNTLGMPKFSVLDNADLRYQFGTLAGGGTNAQVRWSFPLTASGRVMSRANYFIPSPGPQYTSAGVVYELCGMPGLINVIMSDRWGTEQSNVHPTPTGLFVYHQSVGLIAHAESGVPLDTWFRLEYDADFRLGTFAIAIFPDTTSTEPVWAWSGPYAWGWDWAQYGNTVAVTFGGATYGDTLFFDDVTVSDGTIAAPVAVVTNDLYANAFTVAIPQATVDYMTSLGTFESVAEDIHEFGFETNECTIPGYPHTAWWKYTPSIAGPVTIVADATVPLIATQVFVGGKAMGNLIQARLHEPLAFQAAGGTTYRIQVSSEGTIADVVLKVTGPATDIPVVPPWTLPPGTELPTDLFNPDAPQVVPPAVDPNTTSTASLLQLVRDFSSKVGRAVRVTGIRSIAMVDPQEPNQLQVVTPDALYAANTTEWKSDQAALSIISGLVALSASAVLRNDDASILVSGWQLPGALPMRGTGGWAPTKQVSMSFSPQGFECSIDLQPPRA
jgi:hypothetical protein